MANEQRRAPREVLARFCIAGAILVVVVACLLAAYSYWRTSGHGDWSNPGIRGDFYGGHFAAGAGLAGTLLFMAALLLQQVELRLQREELAASRTIAEKQAGALESQTVELKRQNALVQQRDDIQLMLTLSDKDERMFLETPRASARSSPVRKLAFDYIVKRARDRPETALNLLALFAATRPHPSGSMAHTELECAANLYHEPLVETPVPGFRVPWLDLAKGVLAEGNLSSIETHREEGGG